MPLYHLIPLRWRHLRNRRCRKGWLMSHFYLNIKLLLRKVPSLYQEGKSDLITSDYELTPKWKCASKPTETYSIFQYFFPCILFVSSFLCFFNGSIADLQCCVSFWGTAKWFSFIYFFFMFFSVMVYYRMLSIVPCAVQQDLVYPLCI